jgi:hypothetical protein
MGLSQGVSLAVIPWCGMYLVAMISGKAFSVPQAAFHLLLLLTGGVVFLAIALFVSSVVAGEYTAPAVSLGILFIIAATLTDKTTRLFSPLSFMLGTERFDSKTNLLVGSFP